MGEPTITVEGLGKRYRIGAAEESMTSRAPGLLRSTLRTLTAPVRNLRRLRSFTRFNGDEANTLWALREVSFAVEPGEVVGIIGKNGAGKSTLLKILSRITPPSTGRATLRGRVGSLLEVGTGFHPEMTGAENIYLSGAILGMQRAEIDAHFAAIVEFSGVAELLHTPVKRFSSGMYVRLAFAVAAHLRTEIMLIDEVLAVGDAAFQQKCLGHIDATADRGRTILFVSHNLAAVGAICDRVLLIDGGRIVRDGPAEAVIGHYLRSIGTETRVWQNDEPPNDVAQIERIAIVDEQLEPLTGRITMADGVTFVLDLVVHRTTSDLQVSFDLLDSYGRHLAVSMPANDGVSPPTHAGRYQMVVRFPAAIWLKHVYGAKANVYSAYAGEGHSTPVLTLDVVEAPTFATAAHEGANRMGALALKCGWELRASGEA